MQESVASCLKSFPLDRALSSLLEQPHIHSLFLNEYTFVPFASWSDLVFPGQDTVGLHLFGVTHKAFQNLIRGYILL